MTWGCDRNLKARGSAAAGGLAAAECRTFDLVAVSGSEGCDGVFSVAVSRVRRVRAGQSAGVAVGVAAAVAFV